MIIKMMMQQSTTTDAEQCKQKKKALKNMLEVSGVWTYGGSYGDGTHPSSAAFHQSRFKLALQRPTLLAFGLSPWFRVLLTLFA